MKQTVQKKPKVFRTLIRRIHISRKTVRDESNGTAAGRKNEKQETPPAFLFRPVIALSVKTQGAFLINHNGRRHRTV